MRDVLVTHSHDPKSPSLEVRRPNGIVSSLVRVRMAPAVNLQNQLNSAQ